MPVEPQTVLGAVNFDGTAGQGLWTFDRLQGIPRTTRVLIALMSYHTNTGAGSPGDSVSFYAIRPGGLVTERILLGRALNAQLQGPFGDGDYTICHRYVPRDPDGTHWEITAITVGKTLDGTVSLDWVLDPKPDSTPYDGAP